MSDKLEPLTLRAQLSDEKINKWNTRLFKKYNETSTDVPANKILVILERMRYFLEWNSRQ